MHILLTPNAFKNSLTAVEAGRCISAGLKKSLLDCTIKEIAVADGGDGTANLISKVLSAKTVKVLVDNPLGKKIYASYGWIKKSKTAVIELADASGLRLLKEKELNPLKANTKGTGQLIKSALGHGAKKIILGIGGSATVDGASGILHELGVKFLDKQNREIKQLPKGLLALNRIDVSNMDSRLKDCEIIVLCDVANKLLGKDGAAAVFGPQKGADKIAVALLEKCLHQFNKIARQDLGVNMDSFIHGGSAGGVAAGLAAFVNAKLVSGISYFLDIVHFDEELKITDLIITAEGKLDEQTLEGKGPFGIAKKAKENKVPVIILAGTVPSTINKKMNRYFDVILPIGHAPASLQDAMKNTAADLERTAFEIGNLLAIKMK